MWLTRQQHAATARKMPVQPIRTPCGRHLRRRRQKAGYATTPPPLEGAAKAARHLQKPVKMKYFTRKNAARLKKHTIKLLILIFVSKLFLRIKKRKRGLCISFEEKPATEKGEN
jgi:hypothetical protein